MKKLIMVLTFSAFLLSGNQLNETYGQNYNVAYVYDIDSSNGLSFRSFLNANDYPTSLIKISDISTTIFDDFALIMIDSRSGSFGNWGTPQEIQIIQNLFKPILALGAGGSSFYEQLGISINWGNSWTSLDTLCDFQSCIKIFAEDTSLSVFNMPYNINFPQPPISPVVQLYNNSAQVGVYKPALSDTVKYIGRDPIDTNHYGIVAEGELYWLWGFDNSPAYMTQTGKRLLLNIIYYLIGGTTGVNDEQTLSVSSYNLFQNYPNPFNPNTKISYQLPVRSDVVITIYDVLGNIAATLADEYKPAGTYELTWNAANLPSGVYFYQLRATPVGGQAGSYIAVRKMILLK